MTSHNQGLGKITSKPPFWRVRVVILWLFTSHGFAITMTVPRSYCCQIQTSHSESYCECTSFLRLSLWFTIIFLLVPIYFMGWPLWKGFFILYGTIVDLQYCVSFRYTTKWLSYTCIFFQIFSHLSYYRILSTVLPYAIQYVFVGYVF